MTGISFSRNVSRCMATNLEGPFTRDTGGPLRTETTSPLETKMVVPAFWNWSRHFWKAPRIPPRHSPGIVFAQGGPGYLPAVEMIASRRKRSSGFGFDQCFKPIHPPFEKGEKLPKIIDTGFYWYDKTNITDPKIAAVLYD